MPTCRMDEELSFVASSRRVAELCEDSGSAETGYKWLGRYREFG